MNDSAAFACFHSYTKHEKDTRRKEYSWEYVHVRVHVCVYMCEHVGTGVGTQGYEHVCPLMLVCMCVVHSKHVYVHRCLNVLSV